MTKSDRTITPSDILPFAEYAARRKELKAGLGDHKKLRRLEVGPAAIVHFESWDTMWLQIQEMLHIERGGEEQLKDELAAYSPMIPNGRELTATLFFEIQDEGRRKEFLAKLGGVEDCIAICVGDHRIAAVPEGDVERSRPDGKASSVHFLHFPFDEAAIAAFREPGTRVTFEIAHPAYGHAAILPEGMRKELAADFD